MRNRQELNTTLRMQHSVLSTIQAKPCTQWAVAQLMDQIQCHARS